MPASGGNGMPAVKTAFTAPFLQSTQGLAPKFFCIPAYLLKKYIHPLVLFMFLWGKSFIMVSAPL